MCGFVGFIDKKKNKKKIIKDMADIIVHRGPDSDGYYTDDDCALGFRRLSIIDLSGGTQPIYNEDKTMAIIFNGEIYNYQEIRKDLLKKGHKFKTESDTEVILHGYEEYHEKILDKLRGMFAFVIYNVNDKTLFGARDFYGIKPLYYYKDDNEFMFGSEIKSFLGHPGFKKELNRDMLKQYLTFQYSVGEDTFFKNVYKLRPGHYFKYHDGELEIVKYYELKINNDDSKSLDEWKDIIRKELNESIKYHKVSDVEVGSFLSSGVDSSIVATLSDVDKTFTVGYDNKKYSEIDYAKELSDKIGVKNISKKISKEEYFKKFPMIQYYMDEPLADASAVALYFVANTASKHVKVALSGEGADEIFGGYNIYHEPYSVSWYNKIPYPVRRFIGILAYPMRNHSGFNFLVRRSKKLEDRYVGNAFIFEPRDADKVLSYKDTRNFRELTRPYYDKVKDYDQVAKMQYIDFNFWLIGDILLKADKMSMANSLEVRVPFLDRPLVSEVINMPAKYKIVGNQTKYAFREVCKEALPEKWADKKKLGFPVPIREWIKEEDIYNDIYKKFSEASEFFKPKEIIKLLEEHKNGKRDNSRKIWTIYSFLIWYQEYFVKR
mgnify:FL=1